MIRILQKLSLIFVLTVMVAACNRTQPVYNVEADPVPAGAQQRLSSEQVGDLITKAARSKGWLVNQISPGLLHGKLAWHGHEAEVNITYSSRSYSIELAGSENLKETDGEIHRKYNSRIHELQTEIDKRLSRAAYP